MDNLIGKTLGPYTIRRALGRGGMASVFLAYHPQTNREVALKVLPREFLHDEMFRIRFEREAKTIAALEHPAIVPVYDFGGADGQPYIVMRYMPGGSLAERIRQGPLPLEQVVKIFERVGSALDAAHAKGIIHRDVKPANILFDAYNEAYLSDFGIAKLTQSTIELTGSGMVGTPAYIAPEMAEPGKHHATIDIYALGVTLFQALTGALPYSADTPMGLLLAHISQPIPDITTLRPDLPARLQHVIERAMAKDPSERYPTTAKMLTDLEAATSVALRPAPALPEGEDVGATLVEPEESWLEAGSPGPTEATPPAVKLGAAGTVAAPSAPPAKKRAIPVWGFAAGGVIGAALCVGLIAGGIALFAPGNGKPTPAADASPGATGQPLAEATTAPTTTSPAQPTPEPTIIPTQAPTATVTSPFPPVEVQPYCSFYNQSPVYVDAGHPVMLVWSWTATEAALVNDHIEAGIYTITLDGQPVEAVRRSDIYQNDEGYYVVTWYAEPLILSPGTHTAARGLVWTRPVTDGWDTFGPGGEIETEYDECTIIVR